VNDEQVRGFMANIDADASGEIDFKEFNMYLVSLPKVCWCNNTPGWN
jgi:hypothetical protein